MRGSLFQHEMVPYTETNIQPTKCHIDIFWSASLPCSIFVTNMACRRNHDEHQHNMTVHEVMNEWNISINVVDGIYKLSTSTC